MASPEKPVVVVGGGLAGMSAALTLHDAGRRVLLLERRGLLGGRAGSFPAPALGGVMIDNSQHVLLGCCSSLLAFYARLGVGGHIRFEKRLLFADARGRKAAMAAAPLPSPLHLLPSLLRFSLLSVWQRVEVMHGMLRLAAISAAEREQFAGRSFGSLLAQWRQSRETTRRFWDVICVSALNESCEDAAAHFALQVFQEAFLGPRKNYQVGVADVPLSRLYEKLPFEVRREAAVEAVALGNGRVAAVRVGGQRVECAAAVLAVHPTGVAGLLPPAEAAACPELQKLAGLSYSPIMGVHLLYDRRVFCGSHLAMVGTGLQWIFVDAEDPCLLHGVVSAPGELMMTSQQELANRFDAEVRQVCPAARSAKLKAFVIVKVKQATFRAIPGIEAHRPGQATSIPGLYLAGDYTRTGWPATMEGAVRSGRLAAAAILKPA